MGCSAADVVHKLQEIQGILSDRRAELEDRQRELQEARALLQCLQARRDAARRKQSALRLQHAELACKLEDASLALSGCCSEGSDAGARQNGVSQQAAEGLRSAMAAEARTAQAYRQIVSKRQEREAGRLAALTQEHARTAAELREAEAALAGQADCRELARRRAAAEARLAALRQSRAQLEGEAAQLRAGGSPAELERALAAAREKLQWRRREGERLVSECARCADRLAAAEAAQADLRARRDTVAARVQRLTAEVMRLCE